MSVTIYDVAKKAGVGIGTVSRALNNSPQIRKSTKDKILKVVDELRYKPHVIARGLAGKKTGVMAVLMPFYSGHFYQQLLLGLQLALSDNEYDLLVYYVDSPEKKTMYLNRTLLEKRCDAVLVLSMDISDNYIVKFKKAKLPIILVDRMHLDVDCLYVRNRDGAYDATMHLVSKGHQKIAMISGHQSSVPASKRYAGYRQALNEASLPYCESYFISADSLGDDEAFLVNDGFNEKVGYESIKRLFLLNGDKPTAIFAASDILAIGAMKACREMNLRIPEDVAIIGFDDIELSEFMSLTTMQQPSYEMGVRAGQRALEKINETEESVYEIVLSTKLIKRESSGD